MFQTTNGHGVVTYSNKVHFENAIKILHHSGYLKECNGYYRLVDDGEVIEDDVVDCDKMSIKISDWSYQGIGNTIELVCANAIDGYFYGFNVSRVFSIITWCPKLGYKVVSNPIELLNVLSITPGNHLFQSYVDLLTLPKKKYELLYGKGYTDSLHSFCMLVRENWAKH